MMWRILIADDEPKIRRGLRAQIEKMGLDAEVVGDAEDGEDALRQCALTTPDILLVDINMPFLNGLAFIEKLRETRPDARVIVVTGYEDFEYVRQSIKLNVESYLLKPVLESELRTALRQAIEHLAREQEHNRHFAWAMRQLEKRRDSLLEAFLREAVAGEVDEQELNDMLTYFGFQTAGSGSLMLAVIDGAADDRQLRRWMLQYALVDALRPLMSAGRACVFPDDRQNLLIYCDADEGAASRLRGKVEHIITHEFKLQARLFAAPVPDPGLIAQVYDHLLDEAIRITGLSPIVEAAQRYIEGAFARCDLALPDVAAALSVNPTYLSRLMKQELGMSFSKYLTNVRIGHAVRLITLGDMRVRDIAERVGYSGSNYFSTAFKKVLGVSPAEYRGEEKA